MTDHERKALLGRQTEEAMIAPEQNKNSLSRSTFKVIEEHVRAAYWFARVPENRPKSRYLKLLCAHLKDCQAILKTIEEEKRHV